LLTCNLFRQVAHLLGQGGQLFQPHGIFPTQQVKQLLEPDMIVQPVSPCRVRYRRRHADSFSSEYGAQGQSAEAEGCPFHQQDQAVSKTVALQVAVDRDLCQGHAVCMGEAPSHFKVGADGVMQLIKTAVSDEERSKVEAAVKYCPNQALKLIKE
ncbi:MAG: ferredoxin, partial [Nevskiales bacterium]